MPRFQVKFVDDAIKEGLLDWSDNHGEFFTCLCDMEADGGPKLIATDRMEPEDANFWRDLAWVPRLLNELTEEKKRLKVIFLDIDGVMNTPKEWGKWVLTPERAYNRGCVTELNNLIEATDAKVVISSTWRCNYSIKAISDFLVANGFEHPTSIVAATPEFKGEIRGKEIAFWLAQHPEVKAFVILDDDADMGELVDKLIKTNYNNGLTSDNVAAAVEILNV